MNYEAICKHVVVRVIKKPEPKEEKKAVLLLNTAKPWDHIDYAEIISVGYQVNADLEKGDIILMRQHTGVPIAEAPDDKTIRVISVDDILVRLSGDNFQPRAQ